MVSVEKAKRLVFNKYGFNVIEQPDLGQYKGTPIKGEPIPPGRIVIRSDLDDTMKLTAIAHEAGHLLEYGRNLIGWLDSTEIKVETKAWLNGRPVAKELGISQEYADYWKVHLDKLV